jgi:hypothetical protein
MSKWCGTKPVKCDVCNKQLELHFVDGATVYGPWGIMCMTCHAEVGRGLGTGCGQKYSLATLEKVAG